MATDEKYTLSLTKERALAVSKACEFYSRITIQEKCSDFGQKIAFYEDAIERFGGVERGTQAVATCDT